MPHGKLRTTTNRIELRQHFAFHYDVAKPETHRELWNRLVNDFGPQRKQTKAFPEVHPANAFIGNVLRLELLSRYGLGQQLLDESLAYQLYMADRAGTLWENDGAYASGDHGFASKGGVHVLYRDVLGLQEVDTVNKTVQLRLTDSRLDWCAKGECRPLTARLPSAGARTPASGCTRSRIQPVTPSRPKIAAASKRFDTKRFAVVLAPTGRPDPPSHSI